MTWKVLLLGIVTALLTLAVCFSANMPLLAQDGIELKPDTPKLDTQSKVEANPNSKAPLKGQIQKMDKYGHALGGYAQGGQFGGWGRARSDIRRRTKGLIRDNNLEAQVESGIGIIGVKFVMAIGRPPTINRVFPQTPAAKVGLAPNDLIIAVDGVPTFGLTKEEVYDMIVGAPGAPVTLTIKRAGDFMAVTMTRMDLNDITDPFIRRDYMMSM